MLQDTGRHGAEGRCIGTECKIWARALRRRDINHELCGGGSQHIGFAALRWHVILNGTAGWLCDYFVLKYLPEKIAKFLFEYHADKFQSLNLPVIPLDRSEVDVHSLMTPAEVTYLH